MTTQRTIGVLLLLAGVLTALGLAVLPTVSIRVLGTDIGCGVPIVVAVVPSRVLGEDSFGLVHECVVKDRIRVVEGVVVGGLLLVVGIVLLATGAPPPPPRWPQYPRPPWTPPWQP